MPRRRNRAQWLGSLNHTICMWDYALNRCFISPEILPMSARPSALDLITPITLPMSCIPAAPVVGNSSINQSNDFFFRQWLR